ncbi:MAG: PilT protein domain protein, partial [Rhizobiaceae bacterium]|nr:PilT protein domain protein [Rhizobiaceae bacterium]
MSIEEKPTVAAALVLAETGMDFADALHPGKSTHCEGFATFAGSSKLPRRPATPACGWRDGDGSVRP